jgi:acyl-CoA thioester hydrolase
MPMPIHTTTCRVRYADTDKMGFVYHANYFRWFEVGRSELFRSKGIPYKSIESKGIFLPLSEMHCKFNEPSQYDDILVIETSVDTNYRAGMKFDYKIFNENHDKLLASGYTKHACIDSDGRVLRPPKFLLDRIAEKDDAVESSKN